MHSEYNIMTTTPQIDLKLQKKGDDFRSDVWVPRFFNPFACQGTTDPLALFGETLLQGQVKELIFLLDWLPRNQVGSLGSVKSIKQSVKYCEDHWEKDPSLIPDADATLAPLFLGRPGAGNAQAGRCLPLNPLWGLRGFDQDIPADLYTSAMAHIVRPLIRETGAKTIYLCHGNLWWYMRDLERDFPDRTLVNLNHPSRAINWMRKTTHPSQYNKQTWKGEDEEW